MDLILRYIEQLFEYMYRASCVFSFCYNQQVHIDISIYRLYIYTVYNYIYIYKLSQEECARLRVSVSYVKIYRYNPKHLNPKLNGYGDNGHRKVWSSSRSTHCTCSADALSHPARVVGLDQNAQSAKLSQHFNKAGIHGINSAWYHKFN
jgi:hypothetical protein